MLHDDDKFRVLSLVWAHWTRDDILRRKCILAQKRRHVLASYIWERTTVQNLLTYIDLYQMGVMSMNSISLTTHIANIAKDLFDRRVPFAPCFYCGQHVVCIGDFSESDEYITLVCQSRHCDFVDTSSLYFSQFFHVFE